MATIVLDHVDKIYPPGIRAVQDLSLEIADGELVVLLGPSGCGKTTTLRLIAGLETPTSGKIWLNEKMVNSLPSYQRDVAMVFQSHSLYPHLKVRENLSFALEMRQKGSWLPSLFGRFLTGRRNEGTEPVSEVARMLELEDVLERYPGQLSGGQQQRVALGRAVARRPAVTLLDEPLSNLDLQLRNHLRRQLHLLQRRLRVTMVYVTHDQTEAIGLADRIAVMNEGRIHQVGRPENLYNQPVTRLVAEFIGWPPMNFVEGCFVFQDGRYCFQAENWLWPLRPTQRQLGQAYQGRPITLGIRPEHLEVAKEGKWDFPMRVVLVETQSRDCLVTLVDENQQLVAKWTQAEGIEADRMIRIGFDMANVKWFDGASGLALGNSGIPSG
jgi:ABC-type sugar transport system ATPase subunit